MKLLELLSNHPTFFVHAALKVETVTAMIQGQIYFILYLENNFKFSFNKQGKSIASVSQEFLSVFSSFVFSWPDTIALKIKIGRPQDIPM